VATYEQIVEANRATLAAWNAHDPDAVAAGERHARGRLHAHGGDRQRDPGRGRHVQPFDSDGLVVEDVNFWDVGALLAQPGGTR
jgi:hypothetical protein